MRTDWSRLHVDLPDDAIAKEIVSWLGRLYPALPGRLRFGVVTRHPQAFPRFDVGAYRNLARFERLQGELRRAGRRVYFAGDYLMAPSVEGAINSGLKTGTLVNSE
jgi:protoporphyrinogen oxidase